MISAVCVCGTRLQCPEGSAGKKVRCPSCSAVVPVPPAEVPAVPLAVAVEPARATVQSWVYPGGSQNFLVAVTNDSLWSHWLTFQSLRRLHDQLQVGGNPAELLEKDGKRIAIAQITKLEADLTRANLDVHFREQDKDGRWVEGMRQFFLDDAAMRDAVVQALRPRLVGQWTSQEEDVSPLKASLPHFLLLALTLGAVPLLLWIVHLIQGDPWLEQIGGGLMYRLGRAVIHGVQALFRWMGFVADCLVYLLAAAACVTWIVMIVSNFRTPPRLWRLEPASKG
jgi:hypothetical protein